MNPGSILQILFVRAVEEADPRGDVVTWQKREQASRQAAAVTGEPEALPDSAPLDFTVWRFLARRAGFLHDQSPAMADPIPLLRHMKWAGIGLCLAAFMIGWMTHGAGLAHSFDLLAGPFLLVLIWNTIVYALLITEHFHKPNESSKRGLVVVLAAWMRRTLLVKGPAGKPGEAYAQMVASWMQSWCAPGIVSWFHAGSACFTLGLLVAIYFRGLYTGYFVGWESTWLDAHGVGALLGTLLGPASHITGISLPDTDAAWELLRKSRAQEGIPAGPWIHLYAVTLSGWIILPRIVLSFIAGTAAYRKRATPPSWTRSDPYVRRVLALARQGSNIGIAVLPFDLKRPATITAGTFRDAVERLIREIWGQGAHPSWMPGASYGNEDTVWDDNWSSTRDCGGALLLFDAHATPEEEVHGVLLESAWSQFSNEPGSLLVALECSDFDPGRREARIKLWGNLGGHHGFSILPLQYGSPLIPDANPPCFLRRTD